MSRGHEQGGDLRGSRSPGFGVQLRFNLVCAFKIAFAPGGIGPSAFFGKGPDAEDLVADLGEGPDLGAAQAAVGVLDPEAFVGVAVNDDEVADGGEVAGPHGEDEQFSLIKGFGDGERRDGQLLNLEVVFLGGCLEEIPGGALAFDGVALLAGEAGQLEGGQSEVGFEVVDDDAEGGGAATIVADDAAAVGFVAPARIPLDKLGEPADAVASLKFVRRRLTVELRIVHDEILGFGVFLRDELENFIVALRVALDGLKLVALFADEGGQGGGTRLVLAVPDELSVGRMEENLRAERCEGDVQVELGQAEGGEGRIDGKRGTFVEDKVFELELAELAEQLFAPREGEGAVLSGGADADEFGFFKEGPERGAVKLMRRCAGAGVSGLSLYDLAVTGPIAAGSQYKGKCCQDGYEDERELGRAPTYGNAL